MRDGDFSMNAEREEIIQMQQERASDSCPATGSATVTNYHMCQSITGPLMNWKKGDWKRATKYITRNDGSHYTPDELKGVFLDELAKGHEVVPIGECDNFDWKHGCQGHAPKSPNEKGQR